MYRFLFNKVRNIVPRISETELIALRTGNTHMDRQIFEGHVNLPSRIDNHKKSNFDEKLIDNLLDRYGNISKVFPSTKTNEILKFLGENKFFSFLISDKYGGIKLSTKELSDNLTKIASKNPGLGVTVMVPNSLGPGNYYLVMEPNKQKINIFQTGQMGK